MHVRTRVLLISLLVASTGFGAACSPSSLFKRGEDQSVSEQPNTRKINTSCSSVDVPDSSRLDAASARRLLDCFNANQALDPVVALTRSMSDAELESVLELANRYVVAQPARLYEIHETWKSLGARGERERMLDRTGRFLERTAIVGSALRLARGAWASGSGRETLLVALEETGKSLKGPEGAARATTALEVAHAYASSRALHALNARLSRELPECGRGETPCSSKTLAELIRSAQAYVAEASDPLHVDLVTDLSRYAVTGELFEFFDPISGVTSEELRHKVPELGELFMTVYAPDERGATLMDDITSLYRAMNRPIECFGGAASVANGNLDVLRQMDSIKSSDAGAFFRRDNVLKVMAAAPLCHYPPEASQHYGAMQKLGRTQSIVYSTELLQAAWRVTRQGPRGELERPMAKLIVNHIADTGPADSSGVKLLTPIWSELVRRSAWDDLLLLLFLPRVEDRAPLGEFFAWATEPRSALQGKSLMQAFQNELFRDASAEDVANLLAGLSGYLRDEQSDVGPMIESMRSELGSSSANPLLGWSAELMRDARKHEKGIETLLRLTQAPEFDKTLELVAKMARDGRLAQLVDASFAVFERRAAMGAHRIEERAVSPMPVRARHRLSSAELNRLPQPGRAPGEDRVPDACDSVRLGDRIDEYLKPGWSENVVNTISCLNVDGSYDDLDSAARFLMDTRTEEDDERGQSRNLFAYGVDLIQRFHPGAEAMPQFVDLFVRYADDGQLFEGFGALPFVTRPGTSGRSAWDEALALAPLSRKYRKLVRASGQVGADLLEDARFVPAAGFLRTYARELADGVEPAPAPGGDVAERKRRERAQRAARQIVDFARANPTVPAPSVAALLDDYENSVATENLVNGRPRASWSYEDLRKELEPNLHRITPELADRMIGLARQMGLEPGEAPSERKRFTAEWVAKWLVDRASDARPILYRYPGEEDEDPRIRLVSSLDMLELMIINADNVVMGENLSLEALRRIALAWADEDRATWPAEVRKMFPVGGKRPETLREAVEGVQDMCDKNIALLKNLGWFPGLDKLLGAPVGVVKARAKNVRETLPVLFENLPDSGHAHAGGIRLLRQLFFELWAGSPAACQGTKAADDKCSGLKLIGVAGRAGLTHQLGRLFRDYHRDDARLPALVRGAVAVVDAEATPKLARLSLQRDKDFTTVFAAVKQAFETMEALGGSSATVIDSLVLAGGEAGRMKGVTAQAIDAAHDFLTRGFEDLRKRPELVAEATDTLLRLAARPETVRELNRWASTAGRPGRSELMGLVERAVDPREASSRALRKELIDSGLTLLKDRGEEQKLRAAYRHLRALLREVGELWDRPGFPKVRLEAWIQGSLDALAESGTPDEARLARALRASAASVLRSGELEQLFLLLEREPERVSQVLATVNRLILEGDFERYVLTSLQSLDRGR